MKKPKISVIMSVYNTPITYLNEAIDSILNQSYQNFEFIIIDDCSNQETQDYLSGLEDSRIQIIHNPINLGLTKSLNIALKQCKGTYIARMDADDISLPTRFEQQVKWMDHHVNIGACGCLAHIFGTNLKYQTRWHNNWEIKKIRMLFFNAGIVHPTAFLRKSILDNYKITYREDIQKAQDYALWTDLIQVSDIHLIKETLFHYRMHDGQITKNNHGQQLNYESITIKRQLQIFHLSEEEADHVCHFYRGDFNDCHILVNGLHRIEYENKITLKYSPFLLQQQITAIYFQATIKRIIRYKKWDMLINKFFFRVFLPQHFYATFHYIFCEIFKG